MNAQTDRQKHINRVSALLAKTEENGATEAEALAAFAMAQKLMAAWNIQNNEIRGLTGVFETEELFHLPRGGYSKLKMTLTGVIAEANGCCIVFSKSYYPDTNKKSYCIKISGRDDMIDMVRQQAIAAMAYAEHGAQEAADSGEDSPWESDTKVRNAHRRGFWMGFIQALEEKLKEANQEVDDENDGTLLPALRSDFEEAKRLFGAVRTETTRLSAGSTHGQSAGRAAAGRFGTGSVGGSARKAIGG